MASPSFIAYDRTLRRIYMLNLVEALSPPRPFMASLVVNPRTGRPLPVSVDDSLAGSAEDVESARPCPQPRPAMLPGAAMC